MSPALHSALQLADPRGRYSRIDLAWATITLVAGQAAFAFGLWLTGASFAGWRGVVANLAFAWLAYASLTKRLHDLGFGSGRLLAGTAIWFAAASLVAFAVSGLVGPEALALGERGYWLVCSVLMLPPASLAVWLHLADGDPASNRFGPAPASASPSSSLALPA